jgi:hypothetical protein
MWDRHVLPHLGRYHLKEITPQVVTNYRAELSAAGVGDASTRKGLFMLQAVMGFAVLHGALSYSSPSETPRSSRCLPTPACVLGRRSGCAGRASATASS